MKDMRRGALGFASVAMCTAALGFAGCGDDEGEKAADKEGAAPTKPSVGEARSPSGQTTAVEVGVKPPEAGATGVAFTFDMRIGTTTGADPSPPTQLLFHAQKGFTVNGKDFPQCRLADLKAGRLDACAKARIGGGDAEIIRPGGRRVTARISSFNGEPVGGDPVFLYYIKTPGYDPLSAAAPLEKQPEGPYERRVSAPRIPGSPPVTRIRLRTLDRTTKVGGRTVHFIEAPKNCAGSWRFESEATFKSGEKLTVVSPVRCNG
jgi:hypothetical protein